MKCNILVSIFILIPQLIIAQDWGPWETLYNDHDINVEVSFKVDINSCKNNSKNTIAYKVTGSLNSLADNINWKTDYIDCNGKTIHKQHSLDISIGNPYCNGNQKAYGDTWIYSEDEFLSQKILSKFYEVSLLNSNSVNKKNIIDNLIKFQTNLKGREKSNTVKRLKYFSAIDNFVVKDLKRDTSMWEHYDLYSFRFNNTKIVDKLFSKRRRNNNPIIKEYYEKSLEMLANFICTNNFMAVIVANAPVSKILHNHKMIKKANNKSYYFLYNCNTPIFLSKEFIGGGLKVTERQELTENIKLATNV